MLRPKCNWSCNSIWKAYENYMWDKGNFESNQVKLDSIQCNIRAAVIENDSRRFADAAHDILVWGGVKGKNKQTLDELGAQALPVFRENACLLAPTRADTSKFNRISHLNSAWTKVYALLLNDFPIYDGRVGAAMGYLVCLIPAFACARLRQHFL